MEDTFLTIKSLSEGIFKDNGSKFLAFAYPVQSLDEIKAILQEKRAAYYDARHVCYAYMLGHERTIFRTNDDGEPSSTAGKPILGQINARQLTNILIIVVRYFGGVLLGTSGLTAAYKAAANEALQNAEIIEKKILIPFQIHFKYEQMNQVMRIIKNHEMEIVSQSFNFSDNAIDALVRKSLLESVQKEVDKLKFR